MAAKKATGRKKTKAGKKATRRAPRRKTMLARLEEELPPNLKEFSQRMWSAASRVWRSRSTRREKDARRRWIRLMREAERQLGRLEAEGQKRWRKQTTQARRDAVRLSAQAREGDRARAEEEEEGPGAQAQGLEGWRRELVRRRRAARDVGADRRRQERVGPRPVEGVVELAEDRFAQRREALEPDRSRVGSDRPHGVHVARDRVVRARGYQGARARIRHGAEAMDPLAHEALRAV